MPYSPDSRPSSGVKKSLHRLVLQLPLYPLTPLLRDLPAARTHQGEILRRCGEWIDSDQLHLHVSASFPLIQAAEAHRQIEEGHTQGKLVLVT
jgi:NADPH2:quinone reductase